MNDTQLFLSDEAGTLMISVIGMPAPADSDIESPDSMFDEFLGIFADMGEGGSDQSRDH